MQLLKRPDLAKNQRIFLSAFEASQQQVVAELGRQQNVRYSTSHVDTNKIVKESQAKWAEEQDENAAYTLVAAGILLPEYKANFVTSGKKPLLEQAVELPKLTLEDVVRDWVQSHQ